MKTFLLVLAIVALLLLTGCVGLSATGLAYGVEQYCDVPAEDRYMMQAVVAGEIAPNWMEVRCAK